jgi:hypothetical protein
MLWAGRIQNHIRPFFLSACFKQFYIRDGGHEEVISNGGRLKPAFAEIDKKQTMIDLRGISTNWFENQLCSSIRFSRLRARYGTTSQSLSRR